MLLVNHYHYGEPSTPKPQRFVSLLEGHTAVLEALKEASKLEPRDLIPLSVAIEAVTFADEAAPVLYTLRVTCHTHSASWILPPRRYTNFEALHRKIKSCGAMLKASWLRQLPRLRSALANQPHGPYSCRPAYRVSSRHRCVSFDDELPSKFLLAPSRAALVQRAAGLQRYCNELLCNPAALGCSGVAAFFELDTVCSTLRTRRGMGQPWLSSLSPREEPLTSAMVPCCREYHTLLCWSDAWPRRAQGLWRRTRAASKDERLAAAELLQAPAATLLLTLTQTLALALALTLTLTRPPAASSCCGARAAPL